MLDVVVETGPKRVFASAADWPGWSRSGRTEELALDNLVAYAPRYAEVAELAAVRWPGPRALGPRVVEHVAGGPTTDFGAPGTVAVVDRRPLSAAGARRLVALVGAAWSFFDSVVAASPAELRKGPRGGGRDRDAMTAHVLAAEVAYARKIGLRPAEPALGDREAVAAERTVIVETLGRASNGAPLVDRGWPARYAAARIAWHVLDHAWEMQDRSTPG